ncbi:energy transducer TonB [Hydrogenophaga sp. OTU3427]|uniref:energy transducer TonB n=1 Tax=Hydrogenophaga sp. OTU3427 TaxID=3043856 RepID=UPI00313DC372
MKAPAAFSPLQIALGVSVAVHAVLLTVRFVHPEAFNRVFQDTPLEVVLVNARSEDKPDKAQAIAQANLTGGGEAQRGRATSPLPPSAQARLGDPVEEEEKRVEAMKEQQNRMLAQIRKQLASYRVNETPEAQRTHDEQEREERRLALVKLLAEIERRINEENARPKKRYISPATREAVYAIYYDQLRRKIEDRGTAQFPEVGGRKLYGELTMLITVNFDGRVLATEIVEKSGKAALDARAEAIVKSLGFGGFTSAMRQRADQIVVVSRFRFTRDETLQTQQMMTP